MLRIESVDNNSLPNRDNFGGFPFSFRWNIFVLFRGNRKGNQQSVVELNAWPPQIEESEAGACAIITFFFDYRVTLLSFDW